MNKKSIIAFASIFALCVLAVARSNENKTAALMYAAKNNNAEAVARLIKTGADVNAQDNDGMTALMWAAWYNAADAAKMLIEAGSDVNARDKGGKTALIIAEDHNAKDVMALLKAAGAKE